MLLEFSVENFRSFKEKATFSMVATHLRSRDSALDESNTITVEGQPMLLKSSAIYGANASGKSNFTWAVRFFRRFVIGSSKETQVDELIDVEPFRLSTDTASKPSSFETVFVQDGRRYRYGFSADRTRVVSEWLFHVPAAREARLFERNLDEFVLSEGFKEGKGLTGKTRSNALFLSVAAQFNGEISRSLMRWFWNLRVVSGLEDLGLREFTFDSLEKDRYRNQIISLVKQLDLGIEDLKTERRPRTYESLPSSLPEEIRKMLLGTEQRTVKTVHRQYGSGREYVGEVEFELDIHESEGTKRLFSMAGPLIDSLAKGRVLVIDELDARLHPVITSSIVGLFNSKETNRRAAQIVFTTQDSNLLSSDTFRRDQIWFVEKDRYGSTHLYSLAEFKGVRSNESLERGYIRGRYGAIPFIGDLREVVG